MLEKTQAIEKLSKMNSQSILRAQNDSDATLSDGSGSASDLNIDSDFEEKDDVFSQNDRLGKYGNIDMSYRHSMVNKPKQKI